MNCRAHALQRLLKSAAIVWSCCMNITIVVVVVVQHDKKKTVHVLNEKYEDNLTENHLQTWSCLLLFLLFSTKDLSIYLKCFSRVSQLKLLTVYLQFASAQGRLQTDCRIRKVMAGRSRRMCGGITDAEMNLGRVTGLQQYRGLIISQEFTCTNLEFLSILYCKWN